MLNYGYAVLRAAVARGLVAAGLLPAFGVHHDNVQNAFNLADDLLEVIRPVADWTAFGLSGQGRRPDEDTLTREHRQHLVGVMTEPLMITGEQLTVLPVPTPSTQSVSTNSIAAIATARFISSWSMPLAYAALRDMM